MFFKKIVPHCIILLSRSISAGANYVFFELSCMLFFSVSADSSFNIGKMTENMFSSVRILSGQFKNNPS